MDFLKSIVIAFSFFTTIPMPMIEWTDKRMKFVPLLLPAVGAVIGGLAFALYKLLAAAGAGSFLSAALMVAYFIFITGGVHTDGLMDSSDAYFSRREKDRKLEIMKDSRVGAFAVIMLVIVVLLKTAFLYDLFDSAADFGTMLIFIPIISRCLQPTMLYYFPYAKEEGLAKMYGVDLNKRLGLIPLGILAIVIAVMIYIFGLAALLVPGIAALYYGFYYLSSKKNFGGITGDLLGAFLEVTELLMIGAVIFI